MSMGTSPQHAEAGVDHVRDRVLRSATRLFFESGFEGTSVSSIARASGVTAAALYWHFPSKVDILFAVLQAQVGDGYAELATAVTSDDPTTRLRQYVVAFVTQQMEEDGTRNFGYSSLVASLPAPLQQEMWKIGKPYTDLLRDILGQGRASGVFDFADLVVTAFAISTVCEYVFTWYRADGPLSPEVVSKHYSDLVLQMVVRAGQG